MKHATDTPSSPVPSERALPLAIRVLMLIPDTQGYTICILNE